MKTIYLFIFACLLSGQAAVAQNDTLVGVLRDANEKGVRNYQVTLGKHKPLKAKTNKEGVFTIPKANLNDTLYIYVKSEKKEIVVPVNGFSYIDIALKEGTFNVNRNMEPNQYLLDFFAREQDKVIGSNVMTRSRIEKTGCQDVRCLLQRMNGVLLQNDNITIRGISSINSGTSALIVINGISSFNSGRLLSLPIQSIQEITVIKDGEGFGAQGANGVIVVKTHR